jgi:hypothetical protein
MQHLGLIEATRAVEEAGEAEEDSMTVDVVVEEADEEVAVADSMTVDVVDQEVVSVCPFLLPAISQVSQIISQFFWNNTSIPQSRCPISPGTIFMDQLLTVYYSGRGVSTNRGGFGDFKGKKQTF